MRRITKRTELGDVDLDGLTLALRKLADYEDTGLDPQQVYDYYEFYKRITSLPSCMDCVCSKYCDYVPEWGDNARINCFAWESKE